MSLLRTGMGQWSSYVGAGHDWSAYECSVVNRLQTCIGLSTELDLKTHPIFYDRAKLSRYSENFREPSSSGIPKHLTHSDIGIGSC